MSQQSGHSTPARGPQEIEQVGTSTSQVMEGLTQSFSQLEATPRQRGKRPRFEEEQAFAGPSPINTASQFALPPGQASILNSPVVPQRNLPPTMTQTRSTPREIRINPPKDFDGSSNTLRGFLLDVELYLDLNEEIYNSDKAKNMYLLSFFKEKEALLWKNQFLESIRAYGKFMWPAHHQLKDMIRKDFARTTEIEDAITALEHLKQGPKPISEFNIDFKLLLGKAGKNTNTSDNFLIRLYSRAINSKTAEKVITMDNPPTTLEEWMEKAAKFDSNWRRASALLGRGLPKGHEQKSKRQWNFSRPAKDPNAMDIDALALEEKEKLKRAGMCFYCKEGKHLALHCPKKGNKKQEEPKKALKGRDLYTQIRSMTSELTEEEKEALYEIAQEEGGF